MNTTLRDALAEQINQITAAQLNTNELVALGERRVHRHRLTAALGGVAAVLLVVTLAVGGATLLRSADQGPANPPTDRHQTDDNTTPPDGPEVRTRPIVFSYSELFDHRGGSIHFGSGSVEIDDGFVHLDVTDDGFIYTSDGRAWFSDGGTPVQIGSHLCGALHGEFSNFAQRSVMSANEGSLAAWFECAPAARPTLVVYDTSSGSEVARRPIAFCRESCELVDVTADYVYFNRGVYVSHPRPDYRFGVMTHELRASTPQLYAEDLISHSRGLVVGDSWRHSTASNGVGQAFTAIGSRLVPRWQERNGEVTHAFDTATRHAVRLHLPTGYHSNSTQDFVLFQWLDDDTVAIAASEGGILACRLSDGRCGLRVDPAADGAGGYRILPNLPLPG
jgi:hypothetical protein